MSEKPEERQLQFGVSYRLSETADGSFLFVLELNGVHSSFLLSRETVGRLALAHVLGGAVERERKQSEESAKP